MAGGCRAKFRLWRKATTPSELIRRETEYVLQVCCGIHLTRSSRSEAEPLIALSHTLKRLVSFLRTASCRRLPQQREVDTPSEAEAEAQPQPNASVTEECSKDEKSFPVPCAKSLDTEVNQYNLSIDISNLPC
jgi:hypothetical protein